jgi:hypothetical protein
MWGGKCCIAALAYRFGTNIFVLHLVDGAPTKVGEVQLYPSVTEPQLCANLKQRQHFIAHSVAEVQQLKNACGAGVPLWVFFHQGPHYWISVPDQQFQPDKEQ